MHATGVDHHMQVHREAKPCNVSLLNLTENTANSQKHLHPLFAIESGSCSSICTRAVDVCVSMSSMIIFGSSSFEVSCFSGVSYSLLYSSRADKMLLLKYTGLVYIML